MTQESRFLAANPLRGQRRAAVAVSTHRWRRSLNPNNQRRQHDTAGSKMKCNTVVMLSVEGGTLWTKNTSS